MHQRSVAIIGTRGYPSYYGGFETLVRHLAPYLADRGWAVTVYARPGSVENRNDDVDDRITSVFTRGIESKSLSTLTYGLSSTLHSARNRPDVALVMNVANGFWLPILNARNIPTVVNVDGIEWDRAKWGRLAKSMFRLGAKITAKRASSLVTDAEAIKKRWQEQFGVTSQFIPYGGTRPVNLTPVEGYPPGRYVLIVARFVPENTVQEFLSIAEILAEEWQVVIVGSSGYGGNIDDTAKYLNDTNSNISWLGHVSDDRVLFSLWQYAGAYFHGHSVGGTNPALVQAMACGAPIVARDTVYNREVLGENGYFVEPTGSSILAGVQEVLTDPARQEKLRRDAEERSRQKYTWEIVCAAYESTLVSRLSGSAKTKSV